MDLNCSTKIKIGTILIYIVMLAIVSFELWGHTFIKIFSINNQEGPQKNIQGAEGKFTCLWLEGGGGTKKLTEVRY